MFHLRKRYEGEPFFEWLWNHVFWVLGRRELKFWWQRRTRGFDDSELWSLDCTMCKFMAPRLRELARQTYGYPVTFLHGEDFTEETIQAFDNLPEEERHSKHEAAALAWETAVNKIARAMELWADNETFVEPNSPEEQEVKEGFELFHKHLFSLWN